MASMALALEGFPINALGESSIKQGLSTRANNGRIMVFVVMAGGNDGLNTVIPLDRYTELATARAPIMINQNDVLTLNSMPNTGLHPAMTGLQNLYNTGRLNIVQSVSVPNNSYSHFRAQDIYMGASDSDVYEDTGFLGRTLETIFPGAPQSYPTTSTSDPLAIEIGSGVSSILSGSQGLIGLSLSNITSFYNIVNSTVDPSPNTNAGNELNFLRFVAQQTNSYTSVIQQAANMGSNTVTYAGNSLAQQLKIVAQLISGGLETPIYIVRQGGYDTHSGQVDVTNTKVGNHANRLGELSGAISAFQQDITNMGKSNDVSGMTISEFGRRIISNASDGTDHGKACPIIVWGDNVNNTILGDSPVIPMNATASNQIPMEHDYREIYASVLRDWLGLSMGTTQNILATQSPKPGNSVNSPFDILPIFCPNSSLITLNNPCFAALPVAGYHYFNVSSDQCTHTLEWQSREENNMSHFVVERGTDGINFERIGDVDALNGRDNSYDFIDSDLNRDPEAYFYRLKAVDLDETFAYSKVVNVNNSCGSIDFAVSVYPNPASSILNVSVNANDDKFLNLTVFNTMGQQVMSREFITQFGIQKSQLDISSLPIGHYILRVIDRDSKDVLDTVKFTKD